MGTRQESTSEAKEYLISEVNKVDVGTEATAFVFTALLLEGEPEVKHPHIVYNCQMVPLPLYLYRCIKGYRMVKERPGKYILIQILNV